MQSLELFEFLSSTPARMRMAAGASIRVNSGKLWVTAEGQLEDIWLSAGGQWHAPCDLVAWLSAEPRTAFEVLRPLRGAAK